MAYFKPFKSFVVTTIDGVDAELPTLKEAKRHSRELAKDFDMESTVYEVTGAEGHDETDAIWANDEDWLSLNDMCRRYQQHKLTANRIAKLEAKHGVTIKMH